MKRLSEDHKEIQSGKKLDDEGYMAQIELDKILQSVNKLKKVIKTSDHQIPAWVQSKITKASDYLDIAADYLSSDVEMDENTSFTINPESHKTTARKQRLVKKIENAPTSSQEQLPNVKKLGPRLPKFEETSLVDKILAEMMGDKPGCDTKKPKKLNAIAKKHKVSIESLEKQLQKGIKVEMEHTKNKDLAVTIALHHLDEIPDYYSRLNKMEKGVQMNEENKSGDSNLRDWFKKSSGKDPKTGKKVPGWVQIGGPYAGAPCARQPEQKSTPKCGSSKMAANLSDEEEKKAFNRKNRKDPNQPEKTGSAKPTYVKTELEEKEGKKDACYHKVKSRYRVWPSAYACVPEKTSKALCKDGWKTVNELKVGDKILTYNMEKDILEFKPVLNIHRYQDVKTKVLRSGNTGFVFESTDNHKWVVKLPESKSTRISKYNKVNNMTLIETSDLLKNKNNKHLVVAAEYNLGQPTKKNIFYKYGDNWIEYILNISPEQRQTWLFSAIVYDGNQKRVERLTEQQEGVSDLDYIYTSPNGNQSFGFKQKDTEHRDAFLLAAFLNGGTVTWKEHATNPIYCCHYVSNKRYKNTSNLRLVEENIADVWCPETENSTWVMMQETNSNGIITITGNSGALVKCRKVGADNWGKTVDEATTRLPMQTGQLLRVLVNWRGKYMSAQMFFPQLGTPKRDEIIYAVNKIYPDARLISYVPCEMDANTPIVQVKEESELSEDWQKVNKKDRVDGMSQKAVNTYRRENPGSKLQTAVTEKNPTGKRKKRRKNYCDRSKGQQEMHNIDCSKTPDKPICKARRRWKCKN